MLEKKDNNTIFVQSESSVILQCGCNWISMHTWTFAIAHSTEIRTSWKYCSWAQTRIDISGNWILPRIFWSFRFTCNRAILKLTRNTKKELEHTRTPCSSLSYLFILLNLINIIQSKSNRCICNTSNYCYAYRPVVTLCVQSSCLMLWILYWQSLVISWSHHI